MKIYLEKLDEKLSLNFETHLEPLFLPLNKIIIVLWNQTDKKILILNQDLDLQNLIVKLPEYQKEYQFHLYICYQYVGNIRWLEQLSNLWNSKIINFSSLNLIWYCLKIRNKTWQENIIPNSSHQYLINYEKSNSYEEETFKELEKEIENINLEIVNLEETCKTLEFQEIVLLKKNLKKKYGEYQELMDSKIKMILDLNSTIEESQKKSSIFNPKNKEQALLHKNIIGNKKVLEEINIAIQNSSEEKSRKQKELNYLNVQVVDTQKKLKNINLNLENSTLQTQGYNFDDPSILELNPSLVSFSNYSKIAVFLHLNEFDLFPEFCNYLTNLKNINVSFDLYINIAIDTHTNNSKVPQLLDNIKRCNLTPFIYITYSDTRGLDMAGFIKSYLKMLENEKKYDSIIKLHSKNNKNWRFMMLYSLLGNTDIIKHNLLLLKKNEVGMIGFNFKELDYRINKIVKYYLLEYRRQLKAPEYEGFFIPGNIFWIKSCILEKYFKISFLHQTYQELKQLDYDSQEVKSEGRPHSLERLFGLLVHNSGYLTVKYDYLTD